MIKYYSGNMLISKTDFICNIPISTIGGKREESTIAPITRSETDMGIIENVVFNDMDRIFQIKVQRIKVIKSQKFHQVKFFSLNY